MSRACSTCAKTLGEKNRSGLCRSCVARRNNADPAFIARRNAGIQAFIEKPGVREELARRIGKHMQNMGDDERQRRRDHGHRMYEKVLSTPEMRARLTAPEMLKQKGRKRTATVLPWCPPEYLDRYRHLRDRQHLHAAEAKRLIQEEIVADKRRARAAMPAFERQMAALQRGARLVEVPRSTRTEPTMTLGGVSSGLL